MTKGMTSAMSSYTLLRNPVVDTARRVAGETRDAVTASFPSLKGEENKAKLWWFVFGVVFIFTSVVFLQSGSGLSSQSFDSGMAARLQRERELLKKRDLMIDDLRGEIEALKESSHTKADKLVEQVREELSEKNTQLDAAKVAIEALTESESGATSAVEKLTGELAKVTGELASSKAKARQYKEIIEKKIGQIEDLHKKVKEHYEKVNSLQDKISEAGKKVCSTHVPGEDGGDGGD
ncbi:hypothetical protein HKI87_03g23320 [Chloropicon roscoffensis]|uniref:Chromosome partition protein Smc n=1 Tax=Chloropicon roscoffensis TaxID=1461544 RepID=A0AAX4P432_9CHLO